MELAKPKPYVIIVDEARAKAQRKETAKAEKAAVKPKPVVKPKAPAWLTFTATAFTANFESTGKKPGDPGYGITASGRKVVAGLTAACPKSMAFGTRLEIEGLGARECHDRGSQITEGRVDIYIQELKEALKFGRQTVKVRIIEK